MDPATKTAILIAYFATAIPGFALSLLVSWAHWECGRRTLSVLFGLQATLFPAGLILILEALNR